MTQSEEGRGSTTTEWDICALSDISEKIMVGIASAATHAYRSKGVPLLRNQNIGAGWLDDSDVLFVDPEYERVFRNKRLRAGDLLTARTGYPGLTCVVPDTYENAQSFTTLITRPDPKVVDSDYLAAYINSSTGQHFFNQNQIGGAQKNVNAATLRGMPIPLPQLKEQRAIAKALSDVDALLTGLDRLIAKKRNLKQAAMQQLLTGRTRLPGFEAPWSMKRLDAVADIDPDSLGGNTRQDFTFHYIALEDVDKGLLRSYSDQTLASAPSRARRKIRPGDLLVSTVRPNLQSHLLFDIRHGNWVCSTGFCVVRCHERVADPAYVFAHLFGGAIARQIDVLLTGSNYPAINSRDVRSLEIAMPDYTEQTAIAAVLSEMESEVSALLARRDKTRTIKLAMMQQLLTGRIRLI